MSKRAPLSVITGLLLASLAFGGLPSTGEAQFGKRLKDAVKRTAEDKTIQKVTEKESRAIDDAIEGDAEQPAETAAPTAEGKAAPEAAAAPAERKAWANYDFVPGQRTLFFMDFTEDQVGNFPQRLEYKTGGMEIVEFEGGQRALKASSTSDLIIPLPEVLPEKFTIELDIINRNSRGVAASTVEIAGGSTGLDNGDFTEVGWGHNGLAVTGGPVQTHLSAKDAEIERYVGKPAAFRILGDGRYLKVYADEKRIANIPNAAFRRDKALFLRLEGRDDQENAVYVTRIRVAESQRTIYEALKADGRWTTQGILFETGKSEVEPESTPTLKQIAATLKEHPELKVEIQGHTDNVGQAAANLTLSQARAEAVKHVLTSEYAVSADQLAAKGYGDTKPAADNRTAEGRANNRRVELVRQVSAAP